MLCWKEGKDLSMCKCSWKRVSRERETLKIGRVRDLRKGDRGWSSFSIMISGKEARMGVDTGESLGGRA